MLKEGDIRGRFYSVMGSGWGPPVVSESFGQQVVFDRSGYLDVHNTKRQGRVLKGDYRACIRGWKRGPGDTEASTTCGNAWVCCVEHGIDAAPVNTPRGSCRCAGKLVSQYTLSLYTNVTFGISLFPGCAAYNTSVPVHAPVAKSSCNCRSFSRFVRALPPPAWPPSPLAPREALGPVRGLKVPPALR